MSENKFKKKESEKSKSSRIPQKYLQVLNGSFLTFDKSPGLLPFLLFITSISVFLIANTYYGEKKIRQMEKLRVEVMELRTIYISNKSELMLLSNQSDIARKLAPYGLVESTVPPRVVKDDEGNFLARLLWRKTH
jgi:hypothetical protein